jgi:hypothetical protein
MKQGVDKILDAQLKHGRQAFECGGRDLRCMKSQDC